MAAAPSAQTPAEDAPFTLDLANVFSDPDGDAISISIGNLPTWLTFDGSGLSGTPTNAAVGATTLNLTGSAKGKSASSTVTITVNDTNDAPEVTFTPAALAYTENDGASALDGAITVTEIDTAAANLVDVQTVVVQITGNYVNGQDVLAFTDQSGITGNWNASTGTMTLTAAGGVSPTVMQAALRTLTYNNTSELPSESARTVSVTLTDTNNLSSATVTKTINVTQVDDAPIFATTSTGDQVYARGNATSPVRIDNALTLSDADTTNFNGGTLNVSIIAANNKVTDRLSIDNEGTGAGQIGFSGATVTFAGTTIGTVTTGSDGVGTNALNIDLNANATTAAVQALARAITFTNTNATVALDSDPVVNFVLTEQGGTVSNTFSRTVDIVQNNAPTNSAKALAAIEDTTLTFADDTFDSAFADIDGGDSLTAIRIDTLPASGDGQLLLNSNAVTAGQVIDRDDISNLTFVPATNANVAKNGGVTFTFSVSDGKSFAAAPSTATITIAAVDDKPTITMSGGKTFQTPTARAVLIDPGLTLIDPDAVNNSNTGTYADTGTGYLNVNITANRLAGDFLSIQNTGTDTGQIGFNGTTVTYGGTTIGTLDSTLNGGSNQALQVNLTNNASNDAVQALARAVTVRGADHDQGSSAEKTISFTASDGQNVSDTVTRAVDFDGLLFDDFNAPGTTRPTISFDGTDDFISLPGNIAQSGTSAFTIEGWINTSVNSGATQTIMALGDLSQTQQLISSNFDNTTGIAIGGDASVTGGTLVLTTATNDQSGSAIIDPTGNAEGARNFTASFDMLIGGTAGTPADGMSFSYGQNNFPNNFEEGVADGLSIAFDTFDNGSGDTFDTLDVILNGTVVQSSNVTGGIRTAPNFTNVTVTHNDNGLTVTFGGATIINNLALGSNYAPQTSDQFIFAARTGGSNDRHEVDNLTITANNLGSSNSLAVINGQLQFVSEIRSGATVSPTTSSSGTTVADGNWHHVAATHDGNNTLKLYVDGALEQTITGVPKNILSSEATIGSATDGSDFFNGLMSEIRLWNDERTTTEIADSYLPDLSNPSGDASLVGYWRAADLSGQTINDSSANNNDATLGSSSGNTAGDPSTGTTTTHFQPVDSSNWTVIEGTHSGSANDLAYVDDGELVIQNREMVRSADQFAPANSTPVHISGTFKFTGTTTDYFHLMTRADPSSTSSSGFPTNGLNFLASNAGESLTIEKYVNGTLSTLTLSGDDSVTLTNNAEYSFDVYDDGTNLRFTVSEIGDTSNTATVTATDTTAFGTNYVVLTNREDTGTTENVIRLDNLNIDQDIVMAEDATFTGTLPSSGLTGPFTFAALNAPEHGTLTITDAATGAYTYAPASGYHGQDTLSFQVTDANGAVNTQTLSFNVRADLDVNVSGRQMTFDGVNDYLTVPDNNSLDFDANSSFTFELWIKPDSVTTLQSLLDKGTLAGDDTNYRVSITPDGKIQVWSPESGAKIFDDTNLTAGEWAHIALSYDATNDTLTMYQNGEFAGELAATEFGTVNTGPLLIGRDNQGRFFDGQMDEVRIWNEARSADDIRLNYDQQLSGSESTLNAYYRFDDILDGVVVDKSPNSNTASMGDPDTLGDDAEPTVSDGVGGRPDIYGSIVDVAENTTASGLMVTNDSISGTVSYAINSAGTTSFTTSANGAVTIDANTGAWTYTPATNYAGSDTFTIVATGATSGSDTETVTVNVAGDGDENSSTMSDGVLVLDGSGDFAQAPDPSLANNSFSIEFWSERSSATGYDMIVGQGAATTNNGLHIGWRDSPNDQFTFGFFGNDLNYTNANTGVGELIHWAVTYDATTNARILYKNGQAVANDTATADYQGTGNLLIGSSPVASSEFAGMIDEVRVWSDVRTPQEISANYEKQMVGNENNLQAYYRFDDDPDGTTINNSATATGNTLDGTLQGGASIANIPQKAASFDGASDYLSVGRGTNDELAITGDVSLETWVKFNSMSAQGLFGFSENASNDESTTVNSLYEFRITSGGDLVAGHETGSGNDVYHTFDTNLVSGQWYHVSMVRDTTAKSYTVFVNGEPVGTQHYTENNPNDGSLSNLYIGAEPRAALNQFIDGQMSDVRVWNVARTDQEIHDNYNRTLTGNENGELLLNLTMDEIVGGVIVDQAGANDATPNGDVSIVASAPVIQGNSGVTQENQSISGEMTQNDVSGTPTYSVTDAGAVNADGQVEATTANGGKVLIDTTSGAWTYTPANNWYGTDTFVLTANGDDSTDDSETISITVNNDAENSIVINDGVLHTTGESGTYASGSIGTNTISNEVTLELKINLSEVGTTQTLVSLFDTNGTARYAPVIRTTGELYFFTSSGSVDSEIILSTDTWYDIALTYDGTTLKGYLDGDLVASGNVSGMSLSNAAQSILMGERYTGGTNMTNGLFDEVKVWSTVRTAEQIRDGIDQPLAGNETGLEAYYKFDDENTSGTIQDKTSNNRDLTVSGNAKIIDDLEGGVSLDGTDDVITIANDASLDSAQGTWSIWMKTDSDWDGSNPAALITRHDAASSFNGMTLSLDKSGNILVQGKDANSHDSIQFTAAGGVNDSAWHQITFTYDQALNGLNKIFVDGVLVASARSTEAWNWNGQDLLIGDGADTHWEEFRGEIGGVEIYNRKLTDAEVANSYTNETNPATSGLVGLYDFAEGTGTTAANDATGGTQAPDATVTGATWLDYNNDITASTLTIQEDETASGQMIANDMPGTPTYAVQTQATKGVVTMNADGTWDYVPTANFYGTDTFTLRASSTDADGTAFTDSETITVTINSVDDGNAIQISDGVLNLDGTNDYVDIPDSVLSNTEGTVSLRFNLDATAPTNQVQFLFANRDDSSGGGDRVYITAVHDGTNWRITANLDNETITGDVVTPGTWYETTLVWKTDNTGELFLDGNSQGTASNVSLDAGGSGVGINTGVGIGTYNEASNNQHAKALIDEVSIWSAAQSASDIQSRVGQQLVGNETGLTAYYRFDDDTDGTTVRDTTSNDNHGTRQNGADIVDPATDPTVLGNAVEIQTSETAQGTFTPADVVAASASYSAVGGTSAGGTTTLTTTQGGTLSINESTGAWTYTPASGYYGDDSFTLRASSTTAGTTLTDDEVITVTVRSDDNVNLNEGVLDLNGTSQYLSVADTNNLDFGANQSFTLETWVHLNDVATLQSLIDKGTLAGDDSNYRVSVQNGKLEFWTPESGVVSPTEATVTAGEWTHLAVSYDGANDLMSFFKNGEQMGASVSITEVGTTNSGPLLIGSDNQGRFLDGQMDDVRVWNDLRTADEIRENYDQKLSGSENGLAGYWQFDDATTGTVQDLTANNNDGTLTSGAQVVRTVGPSLSFDGTDDVVTVTGIDTELQNKSFTIEFWSYRDATDNGAQIPIGIAGAQGDDTSFLHLGYTNGTNMRFSFNATGSDNELNYTDTGGSLDEWAHWAATYDATTNQAKLFKDGVVVGIQTFANDFDGSGNLTLGYSGLSSQYFDGNLNDVRIWNTVRTDDEIASNYNTTLTGNQGGTLVANYTFEEASGNAINTANAGTYDGTISGATRVDDIPPIVGRAVTIDENEVVQGQMGADGADSGATYAAGTPSNGGAVTIDATSGRWTYTPKENFHGTETFVLTATGSQGTVDAETITVTVNNNANVSPITSGGVLVLDGTDDYVTAADSATLDQSGAFTLEAWVNLSNPSSLQNLIDKSSGGNVNYRLFIENGHVGVFSTASGTVKTADNLVTADTWTHVSASFDGTNVTFFINGDQITSPQAFTSDGVNAGPLYIGRDDVGRYVNGMIDDVRIWGDARTPEEIRDNYDQMVASNADNLAANFIFDNLDGTVSDRTANNNDGTLTNGANIASPARAALSFDGGDHVAVGRGTGDELAITGDLTLEGWFKVDQIGVGTQRLISFIGDNTSENAADNALYELTVLNDGKLALFHEYGSGSDEYLTSAGSIDIGQWVHISAVRDTSEKTQKIFVNGELMVTRNYANETDGSASGTLVLGAETVGGTGSFFQGDMSDIRIWNTARTDQQIADNYDNTIVGDESGALVAHYTFDETSGQTITDSAGNNDGTLGADGTTSTDDPSRTTSTPDIHSLNVSVMEGNTAQGTMTGDDVIPGTVTFGVSANTSVTGATSRTISNKGTVEIDSASGDWTFTPLDGFNGTASFYLTASGDGITDSEQITITVQAVDEDSVNVGGSVIQFDGTDDALDATIANMNTNTGAFTYETWFNTEMTARGDIINIGTEAGGMSKLHIENGKLNFDIPGNNLLQSNDTFNDGNWHHTAVTYDGTVLRMYVDGELISENASASITVASGATRIGAAHTDATSTYFDGMLDETRLWSTQRSHEEIRDNYNQQLAGNETGLQAYYTYEDRNGSIIDDATSNNNDLQPPSQAATPVVLDTLNKALSLNGTSQYMTSSTQALTQNSEVTIESWIKWDGADTTNTNVIASLGTSSTNGVYLGIFPDSGTQYLGINIGGKGALITNHAITANDWAHVAVSKDNGEWNIYVNGDEVSITSTTGTATSTVDMVMPSADVLVGYSGFGDEYFGGEIADVRIWDTGRSAAEIADNYNRTITGNENGDLTAHYEFESVSGTTVTDSAPAASGGALQIDNINQYMTISNDNVLDNRTQGTIETWIYLDDNSDGTITVAQKDGVNTTSWFGVGHGSNIAGTANGKLFFHARNNADAIGNTVLATGQWHHVAVAFDTTDARFYVNGQLDATVTGNFSVPGLDSPINTVGQVRTGGGTAIDGLDGRLDDLRIWNEKRTASEIANNYQETLTGNQGGNLIAHYTFEEGSGSTATDSAGSNNGTLSGNPTRSTDTPTLNSDNDGTLVGGPSIVDAGPDIFGNTITIGEDQSAQGTMTGNDVIGNGSFSVSAAATNGTVSIDASTGEWTYVPNANYTGNDTFTLQATGGGLTDQETITVTVSADANPLIAGAGGTNVINLPPAALDLDGTGDYVEIPSAATSSVNMTVETWFKWDGGADYQRVFDFGETRGGAPNDYMTFIVHDGTSSRFTISTDGAGSQTNLTGPAITTGEWTHIAVSIDGTNDRATIYVNGEAFSTGALPANLDPSQIDTSSAFIGRSAFTADPDTNGQFADFRIWNDVRTADEIASNYKHLPKGDEAGLQLNYHFDAIDGTTIADESTNSNNGTAQGDPAVIDPRTTVETNAVTITNAETISGTMPSTDVTGTTTFTISNQPEHGTIEIDSVTGLWTYAPTSNYVGNDSFTIRATGATSGTDDEVISVVVNDSSAISNIPTQSALLFDGVNDYVNIGEMSENISGAYTMESWVYFDPDAFTDNGWMRIMELGNGPDSDNLLLAIDPTTDLFSLDTRNGATASGVKGLTTPATAQWIHVAGVNDGAGNAHLYINGELVNSASGQQIAQDVARTNNYLGQSNWADESNLHGALADVRIWNDARTSAEIRDNYNKTLNGNEDSLVLNYTFDNVDDGVVRDITGNNNNGQVITDATETTATGVGPTGDMLELDGTGDAAVSAVDASIQILGNMTYEAWINPDDLTTRQGFISIAGNTNVDNTSNNILFHVELFNGNVRVMHEYATGGSNRADNQFSNHGLALNKWNHIAVTRDITTNSFALFINGEAKGTYDYGAAGAFDPAGGGNANLTIGAMRVSDSDVNSVAVGFNGSMDNVRIWDTVRSAEDIRDGMSQSYDYDTSGLVAQYTFNDIEGSSTVLDGAHSQAGGGVRINDLNSTLIGDAEAVDSGSGGGIAVGFLDSAIRFDGTNDTASDPSDTIGALGAAERTIMLWAKSSSEEPQTFVSYGAGGEGETFQFGLNTWDDPGSSLEGGKGITIDVGSGAITFQPITATDDGQWHHYTVVLPTGGDSLRDLRVYQDGVLLNTISALFNNEDVTINTQASALNLGHQGSTDYFNGDMAEISVWSSALTTAQINQHMAGQLSGDETDLTAYWRGDDDGSGNLKDYAGNNDLTLANGASIVDVAPDIQSTSVRISEDTIATGQVSPSTTNSSATYAVQTAATSGTVTVDSATGVWNYIPNAGFSGTDTFTLRSTGDVTTESQTISVRVGENPSLPANHALTFDGQDDYVDLGSVDYVEGAFSAEAWVNFNNFADGGEAGWSRIFDIGDGTGSGNTNGFLLTAQSTTGQLALYTYSGGTVSSVTATSALPLDEWTHVAAVNDGAGSASLYVNGSVVASTSSGTQNALPDMTFESANIGRSNHSNDSYFNGKIAEARIWNDARTSTEIANNYDRQLSGDEEGLAGYWTFNEAEGSVAIDQSGNGHNGTVIGAAHEDLQNISVAANATYKGLILGADADDNDTLSYSASSNLGGRLSVDTDGSYEYTNNGADETFDITITDSDGNQTIETINVDVP